MKYNILTVMENGQPLLPPMQSEDGYCLAYEVDGVLKGGFSVMSDTTNVPNSCIVQVECSEAVFADMINDPAFNIRWWEEVIEPEVF